MTDVSDGPELEPEPELEPKPVPIDPLPVDGAEGLPAEVKNGDPSEAPDSPPLD